MSADHRVEAWVKLHTPRRVYPTAEHHEVLTKRAEATLRVLDAADREQGIHRVKVDDATVEKVSRKLAEFQGDEWVFDPPKMDGWDREGTAREVYERQARAVLAALTGAES